MKRFLAILAATAASAAVAATITLPAGADDQPASDRDATVLACLRGQGLDLPADAGGRDVKNWVGAHGSDPAVVRALKACKLGDPGSPEELVACLRTHGLSAPAQLDQFKPWTARQWETTAGRAALEACGLHIGPDAMKSANGGPCSGGGPKAESAKRRATAARRQ